MKQEIKKIVLVGVAGIFACVGLFAEDMRTTTPSTANAQAFNTANLIKKIEIDNQSKYKVEVFYTEQDPEGGKTKVESKKVGSEKDKTARVELFGEGKLITEIQYVILDDKSENKHTAALPYKVAGSKPVSASKKVKLDVTKTEDKVLKIVITNAEASAQAATTSRAAASA